MSGLYLVFYILVILTSICVQKTISQDLDNLDDNEAKLHKLIDKFWNWRLSEWPHYGTKYGISTYNDKMDNYTEEAFTYQVEMAAMFLTQAKSIDTELVHEQTDKISLLVLQDLLENFISGYQFRKYGIYNLIGTIIRSLDTMITRMPTNTFKDYQNILARYELIPNEIKPKALFYLGSDNLLGGEDITVLNEIAVSEGTTYHTSAVKQELVLIDQFIESGKLSSLWHDELMPLEFNQSTRTDLIEQAANVIINDVIPALQQYKSYLENEYLPAARVEAGVSSLPGGEEFYQACLKWHLSVNLTPQEIHDIGLKEVTRIENKMQSILTTRYNGTFKAYIKDLKKDKDRYFANSDEMMQGFRNVIQSAYDELPSVLEHIPENELSLQCSAYKTLGFYIEPSLDGSRLGTFYVDCKNVKNLLKLNMKSLTLHETVPGHHLQASYNLKNNLPDFRRAIEYGRHFGVPFNWLFYTAYSEGWALYAEFLGEEMGIYQDSESLLGRYASEIFRAVRLVVDTGIHAFGWSIEDANEYMKQHTVLTDNVIASEVMRYVGWPGQACAYKIGELKISELRKVAETQLGSKFDLQKFHDEVLSLGPVPLGVLEEQIWQWIDRAKHTEHTNSSTVFKYNMLIIAILTVVHALNQNS